MGFMNATEETRYLCLVLAQKSAADQAKPSTASDLVASAAIMEKFIKDGQEA